MVTDETYDASMLDHDTRLLFDILIRDLTDRGAEVHEALAAVRRVAADGNGWTA